MTALTYSRNGERLVSGSAEGSIKIFNPRNGQEAIGMKLPKPSSITNIQFSDDEYQLIVSSNKHGAVIFDGTPINSR